MAEFVQQNTEEMLPELEQMERVQLFRAEETRIMLKKRTAFEYRLRRRKKEKEDFLQYIQYEVGVLSLVKERRKRIGYFHKHLEIDQAIIQRIHRLFRVVCNRFQDDPMLWLSYIEFCQQRGEKVSVTKLYSRMLQIHNRNPDIWVSAAKFELEQCGSMENARQILQRGLRFNPLSKQLWREYFRMELLNTEKLLKKREVLGIAKMEQDKDVTDAILQGKLAQVVYENAIQNFENDVEFILSLLEVCQLFPFTEKMEKQILIDVQAKHQNNPLTWNAMARQSLRKINLNQKKKDIDKATKAREFDKFENECFQVYENAVSSLCNEKMYDLYLETCLEIVQFPKASSHSRHFREVQTLRVFNEAATAQCLSQVMALKWMKMLADLGDSVALTECVKCVVKLHPHSVSLWTECLTHQICQDIPLEKVYPMFKQALASVDSKESLPLWRIMYEWITLKFPQQLQDFLEYGLAQCSEVAIVVKQWFLEATQLHGNIKQVRALYKRLSASSPLSLEFFEKYISIEKAELDVKIKKVKSAYEDAIREYGNSSPELWLGYIQMEIEHPKGSAENAGTLHWRALKALEGKQYEQFNTQYTLLQNGCLN